MSAAPIKRGNGPPKEFHSKRKDAPAEELPPEYRRKPPLFVQRRNQRLRFWLWVSSLTAIAIALVLLAFLK
jgi:hypothetical protein